MWDTLHVFKFARKRGSAVRHDHRHFRLNYFIRHLSGLVEVPKDGAGTMAV